MFEHKLTPRFRLSLLAALLALTLLPFSALAVTENTLEAAPEDNPIIVGEEEDEENTASDWDENYLPYERYLPERGTTPEEDQYYHPRLSDGELARYWELLSQVENGEISLDGIPSCANRTKDKVIGVYSLDPKDFDGETFYVILPWEGKMDDSQLLSLMVSFRELGIDFDPDSLNERNCTRQAYSGENRFLSGEEERRQRALRYMIVRGMLTETDVSPESACLHTEPIPGGYGPFYFYPYRSLTDEELAATLLIEYSAWETDPDLIERTALDSVRRFFRLPLALSVTDENLRAEDNVWRALLGDRVNRYTLDYATPDYSDGEIIPEAFCDMTVWLLEVPGEAAELEGFSIRFWEHFDAKASSGQADNEYWVEIAKKWLKKNLLIPEDQLPAEWMVTNEENAVYLIGDTDEWQYLLTVSKEGKQVDFLSVYAEKYLDYFYNEEPYEDESGCLPTAEYPSERTEVPENAANQPLEAGTEIASGPWLTDLELARIRILTAGLEAGTRTYEGPSIVNASFDDTTGAAVYPLNPGDFDGESFYVLLPESSMNDEQLLALASAFRELGIDPDSLNSRNCCRFSNATDSRPLTSGEQSRYRVILDKILCGQLRKADIPADTHALTAEKTTVRTYGSNTNLFHFYPYRKLTDDELALFIFAETEGLGEDPNALVEDAIWSAMDLLSLPTSSMLTEIKHSGMDINGRTADQYTNTFFLDSGSWTGTCIPHWLTVKHMQEAGRDPVLSGIRLDYAYTDLFEKTAVYSEKEAEQTWIAAAQQWAAENLKLPAEVPEWTVAGQDASGRGNSVQLQLLTDTWDIRLWIYTASLQPYRCFLYSRPWYSVTEADLSRLKELIVRNEQTDLTKQDLIDCYNLANGYFF